MVLSIRIRAVAMGCAAILMAGHVFGGVETSEFNSFPETDGWTRNLFCTPERALENGSLLLSVAPNECAPPPVGDRDTYIRSVDGYEDSAEFFIEWRVYIDGDSSEFDWGGPVFVTAWTFGPVFYGCRISEDRVLFEVDDGFEHAVFPLEKGSAHTFRLELVGAVSYSFFVDDGLMMMGTPSGNYLAQIPSINLNTASAHLASEARWDYIRFGDIPTDGSGDFDSEGGVELRDWRYFVECVERTGITPGDPGCRWADMDFDGDVDLADFATFQALFGD
jgi:hypothetical protein